MAVASARPYASLHVAPDRYPCHPPLNFLQAGCPSCRPTNSVKALKAKIQSLQLKQKTICNEIFYIGPFGNSHCKSASKIQSLLLKQKTISNEIFYTGLFGNCHRKLAIKIQSLLLKQKTISNEIFYIGPFPLNPRF